MIVNIWSDSLVREFISKLLHLQVIGLSLLVGFAVVHVILACFMPRRWVFIAGFILFFKFGSLKSLVSPSVYPFPLDFPVLQNFLLSPGCFSFMYRSLSNMMISSSCLPLSIWASYLLRSLSLLALGLPMQSAKAAPTLYKIEPNITRHTLPLSEVPGANIDRSSLTVGEGGVLVHYISSDVDFATATQAIIVVHGRQRDADRYFLSAKGAVEAANKSKVVIMAVRTLSCSSELPS